MLVVVDLPFDPVTKITPNGRFESFLERTSGTILSNTRPGKAEPPPRNLAAKRTHLASRKAGMRSIRFTRGNPEEPETGKGGEASPSSWTLFA